MADRNQNSSDERAQVTVALNRHDRVPTAPLLRELPYGTGPRAFWRRTLRERKYLLFCFFVPALLMWLIYSTLKVYPFGEESVLVLDLNGQYVYYFEALRDIIYGGGSLLYTFRRALGGEFLGIIGYYIASPFSIITAIFPDSLMTEALLVMFLLKTGLCGLTFGVYVDATRKVRNRPATVIFATMYALSAYAVVMQNNTMWIDNLIWLPLILLGIENLVRRGKFKLYVITLALAISSNFYIGYMMCIFCALYFLYYYYSIPASERNPLGVKFHLPKTFARFALFSFIAVAICALTVWGSYYSLTFGKTEFSNPNFAVSQRFDFLDMMSKMYFGSYDTVRPAGWPLLYCGMLSFILIPLYFFAKKVTLREKIARFILCLVIVLSFNMNPIDMAWHGFQKPNWLNYRYSFMLVFILLIMAYKAFDEIKDIGFRAVFISGASITALLFVLQKLEYENLPDLGAVWASFGFIVVYVLMLRASTWKKESLRKTAALVLCIFVSFEAYAAGLSNLIALDDDVKFSSRTGYRNFIDKYQPVADRMHELDTGFYRAEKTYHRKTNDNMAIGLNGVSNSTSTLNAKIIKVLARYGISSRSHWSKYLGGTEVFDSLFGIRYVLSPEPGSTSPLYEKVDVVNDVGIYKNPYAMSVAAGVNEALASLDVTSDDSPYKTPFEVMNATVTAMLGSDETIELFKPTEYDTIDTYEVSKSTADNHLKYVKEGDNAYITIRLHAERDGNILMYIPSSYTRECKLYVNGKDMKTYFGNETCRIVDLGTFVKGQSVDVKFVLQKDNLYLKNGCSYFYMLDEDLFKTVMPALKNNSFKINEYSDDSLSGTIVVTPGKELIYTSIPYDEGWHVKANGAEVETFEILGGLMAFRLDVGTYNLSMNYMPDCVKYGGLISCGAIVVFVLICVGDTLIRRRRRRRDALARYADVAPDIDGAIGLAQLETTEDAPDAGGSVTDDGPVTDDEAAAEDAIAEAAADADFAPDAEPPVYEDGGIGPDPDDAARDFENTDVADAGEAKGGDAE